MALDGVGCSKIDQSLGDDWVWCMNGMCICIGRHVQSYSYIVRELNT